MAHVVVALDVLHVHGPGDARHLVELAGIAPKIRIIDQAAPVALEVVVVDRVEAHQGGEGAPVGLGDARAGQVALPGQTRLQFVEGGEEGVEGFLVGSLAGGEAGLVDAVVDGVVDGLVDGVDGGAQFARIVVLAAGAEFAVEHADDLGGFVVDDGLALLVPQRRHRHPARVAGVGLGVDLVEAGKPVDDIRDAPGRLGEHPALVAHQGVDHRQPDRVLEPLEGTHDHGAVGPRARQRHVKVVAPGLGLEPRGAVGGDPVAELALRAHEAPARLLGVVPLVVPDAVDQSSHVWFPVMGPPVKGGATAPETVTGSCGYRRRRARRQCSCSHKGDRSWLPPPRTRGG